MSRPFNPYTTLKPASGPLFIGREAEIERLAHGDENTVVFGYSRWGKTSLLQRAMERARSDTNDAIVIYNSGSSPHDFLESLKQRLRRVNSGAYSAIVDDDNIEAAMLNMDDYYHNEGRQLRLFIDETRDLFSQATTVQEFRAFNQQMQHITFSYAIFPDVFENMQLKTSRFQDSTSMVPLPPLNYAQTRELITLCTNPMSVDKIARERSLGGAGPYTFTENVDTVVNQLFEETGGFAFLVQGFMEKIIAQVNEMRADRVIDQSGYEVGKHQYRMVIMDQLAHIWAGLSDLQKEMLQKVRTIELSSGAHENGLPSKSVQAGEIYDFFSARESASVLLGALNPLTDRGLGILRTNSDGTYSTRGKLLAEMVDKL